MPLADAFGRHAKEHARLLSSGSYQRTPEGVLLRNGALLRGEFTVTDKYGVRKHTNVITDGGITNVAQMLGGGTLATTYIAPWGANGVASGGHDFIPPFGADPAPTRFWTQFAIWLVGEHNVSPNGYTEGNRPTWVVADEGSGVVGNTASHAVFTMATAGGVTNVDGIVICTDGNTKGASAPGTTPSASIDWATVDREDLLDGIGPTATVYGTLHAISASGGDIVWIDPSNDDYFDSGLGHWVDVGTNSYGITGDGGFVALSSPLSITSVLQVLAGESFGVVDTLCAVRFDDAPHSYNNGDLMDIIYKLAIA